MKKLCVVFLLLAGSLLASQWKQGDIVDPQDNPQWWWDVYLSELTPEAAIFVTPDSGLRVAVFRKGLGKLYKGERLIAVVRKLRFIKKLKAKTSDGFDVRVWVFEAVNSE